MSLNQPIGTLKSPADDTIPFDVHKRDILQAQIRINPMFVFNNFIKKVVIRNQDGLNTLTYRTQSPSSVLKIVPIASEVEIVEWNTSYLEINPNAVSGSGELELDLVIPEDAKRRRSFHNGF